jgi:hypothetical protein
LIVASATRLWTPAQLCGSALFAIIFSIAPPYSPAPEWEVPMADKTFVFVAPVAVKEVFDSKYKSTAPKRLNEALAKAINRSSKLTTKPPADKKAEGFYLDGSLTLKKTDKGIEAELKMVMADWPKKSIFATASTKASVEGGDSDKDVNALLDALVDGVQAKVLKEFENRVK